MNRTVLAAIMTLALTSLPAWAYDYSVNGLRITHPWTRATAAAGASAVGYLSITNTGTTADSLIGASCPIAKSTEIHQNMDMAGVMKMRPVKAITLPPGKTVQLKPGGLHLMLIGTRFRLDPGGTIPCTLNFTHAGPTQVMLTVEKPGATKPAN